METLQWKTTSFQCCVWMCDLLVKSGGCEWCRTYANHQRRHSKRAMVWHSGQIHFATFSMWTSEPTCLSTKLRVLAFGFVEFSAHIFGAGEDQGQSSVEGFVILRRGVSTVRRNRRDTSNDNVLSCHHQWIAAYRHSCRTTSNFVTSRFSTSSSSKSRV